MIELAYDRWFPIVNLILATGAATLWYLTSGRLGWPLAVAICVPWLLRMAAGHFPYRRSRFDVLLFIFGLTAVAGVFTAYNGTLAEGKFWILLGAIALYFALISVSRRDLWLVAGATGPIGALLAFYFVMSNDWQRWPAEIALFNRIGAAWMSIRPSFPFRSVHPNAMGGMIALLLPFTIAFGVYVWRKRRIRLARLTIICGVVSFAGLTLTSALGAWLALLVGLGFWLMWAVSGHLRLNLPISRKLVFGMLALILVVFGLFFFALLLVNGYARTDGANRLSLARQTIFLIRDFSITGSGLGTFPALYAQYIQVTPAFFAAYSNLFLDIWLEQGFLAFSAVLILIGGCFWLLIKQASQSGQNGEIQPAVELSTHAAEGRQQRRKNKLNTHELKIFHWAAFTSLAIMVIHGLIDDALYSDLASPLLFFAPGMVIIVTRSVTEPSIPAAKNWRKGAIGWAATAVLLAGLFVVWRQPIIAKWYANLGALELARVELVNWPTNQWDRGGNLVRFKQASSLFERAAASDPQNPTAVHRLGLISMLRRDYDTAVMYLEQAHENSGDHRGIVKSLGYSYVWNSQFEQARDMLAPISEARVELAVYSGWWERQYRPDLASKASEMVAILENATALKP